MSAKVGSEDYVDIFTWDECHDYSLLELASWNRWEAQLQSKTETRQRRFSTNSLWPWHHGFVVVGFHGSNQSRVVIGRGSFVCRYIMSSIEGVKKNDPIRACQRSKQIARAGFASVRSSTRHAIHTRIFSSLAESPYTIRVTKRILPGFVSLNTQECMNLGLIHDVEIREWHIIIVNCESIPRKSEGIIEIQRIGTVASLLNDLYSPGIQQDRIMSHW